MRVCLITIGAYPHIGGKATHIRLLHEGLARLGVDVSVLSANSLGPGARLLLSDGPRAVLDAVSRGAGLDWSYRVRGALLRRAVVRDGFDIVHCHDVPIADALRSGGAPMVLTVHGDAVNEYLSEGKLIRGSRAHARLWRQEVRAYACADAVVTVDSRLRDHVAEASGRSDAMVLPNTVDTRVFAPWSGDVGRTAARNDRRRGLAVAEGFVFLSPRRLVPKNGLHVAIRALAGVPGATLLLAGDGPSRESLQGLAQGLGVADRVVFLGDVGADSMQGLYAAADAVIIPSVTSEGVVEATSLAALEGMSCGLPVIASAIGGLRELIDPGDTGLLFAEGDDAGLSRLMAGLMSDPGMRRTLGDSARNRVLANHSAEAGCKRLLDIYNGMMDKRKGKHWR